MPDYSLLQPRIGYVARLPAGEIPKNWMRLNGQKLSKKDYPELKRQFDINNWSFGEDEEFYNLPDLGEPLITLAFDTVSCIKVK